MTSINPFYTFNYSQPSEYRFSHDSVFLARRAFETLNLSGRIQPELRVLDLCSGCGIVGLDFLFHCVKEASAEVLNCDFLEVQTEYAEHFHKNVETFRVKSGINPSGLKFTWLQLNYDSFCKEENNGFYDLILCNPPYFFSSQGRLSPSDFKNRCRFYLDSDFPSLIQTVCHLLAKGGMSFLLSRLKREDVEGFLSDGVKLKMVEEIRGTPLYILYKEA